MDPVATALDRSASTSRRVAAVRMTPGSDAAELMPLVVSVRHPFEVRQAAVGQMLQADADHFWNQAAVRIRGINDWPMLSLLCERAALGRRSDFIPALVQSWARPSIRYDDADRPERLAIARLHPDQPPEDLLWPLFQDAGQDRSAQRLAQAAWLIMCRTCENEALRMQLLRARPQHRLHSDLQSVAAVAEHLPRNREELLRLGTLCDASSDRLWDRRGRLIRSAEPDIAYNGVALRHLPVIDHADEAIATLPRQQALSRIAPRLAAARHVHRAPPGSRRTQGRDDTLASHADALSWADLLVIEMMLDALADRAVVAALFEQAERDRVDATTEYGGVLTWGDDGQFIAQPFEPMLRRRDEEFIASDACVRAMHTGLAHYHFHAQRYDNAAWAGPGGGDTAFADNLLANCIVFTFIDRNTLNADAHFPGGITLDLGCIQR
ncbi:MAG: hypothetical protein AAGA29_01610 [Planctomycetota bacterium]